ncbi:MAG: hypothetical protein [Caudoviricetes sp.]|nr:MAG: hypothetical protein [Caudoviricetes sp.]
MAHIYSVSEWKSATGDYHCGDVSDLGNNSNAWWIPCRILGISPEEYVKMLVEQFKVDYLRYEKDSNVLFFSWKTQSSMRKYKTFINKKAKEKCAYVC